MRNRMFANPTMLILFALMAFSSLRQYSSIMDWAMHKIIILPGIVIGLSFHEFAHAAMANKLGDPTAKNLGRVTIDPRAHFDPFGFLALLFLGFGWGVPVPVNPYNFKKRRRDDILVSVAGVVMNLILAVIFGGIYVFIVMQGYYPDFSGGIMGAVSMMVLYIMQINLVLLVFNLIPVPPLDGFRVAENLFNLHRMPWYDMVERNGFLILLILIILGVVDKILSPGVGILSNGIVQLFVAILG